MNKVASSRLIVLSMLNRNTVVPTNPTVD